jgi:hypothetical protein
VTAEDPPRIGAALARALATTGASAHFLALDPERFDPELLAPLAALPRAAQVFGFGTTGSPGAAGGCSRTARWCAARPSRWAFTGSPPR